MLDYVICEWWEYSKIHYIKEASDLIKVLKNNAWTDVAFFRNARILNEEEKKEYNTDYLWWWYVKVSIPENGKIWAYIWENIELNTEFEYKYSILKSIKYWTLETYNQTLLTFKWLWILVRKIFNPETKEERQEAIQQVSWPIWIVDFISNSMEWWIIFLIVIWAIISINLWVFNLLPIPALDWWRFLFITVNGLIKKIFWRKAISEKTEWIIHVWFFVLLIALSLLIAYNDISKIIIR
jgi:RIP metalloprotease RseP